MSIYSDTKRDRAVSRSTIKFFIRAMTVKKIVFYLCFLSVPVTFITSVLVPLLIADTIQDMVTHNYHRAEIVIWILAFVMIFNIALKSFWNWMFNIDGINGAKYIHRTVFSHIISQDYDFFSNQFTGALSSYQLRILNAFVDYNHLLLYDIPAVSTIVIGSVVVLFTRSPLLGLITLICVVAISMVTVTAAVLRLKERRVLSFENGQLAGQLSDSLGHATTVKALAKEKSETKRFLNYVDRWATSQGKIWFSYIYSDSVRTLLHTIMFVVILSVSLLLFREGKIGVATVTLIQIYTISLLNTTIQIAELIKRNETDMSDSYQMMKIMQIKPKVIDPINPRKIDNPESLKLQFSKVSFNYESDNSNKEVINDLSFSVNAGEKVGIVGASGAGKTTITKLILRFYDVEDGNISLNGVDIRELSQEYLRSIIAYVPQEPLLFFRTIRENISYGNDQKGDLDVNKVAKQANVTEFTDYLKEGLDTLVGERGVKLSGGQRQRVAIARAMLRDSPLLVLDEATSALDSETESYIQEALWKLMENKTAVVIAHRLSTIQKMDRIIVIKNGKLAEDGTHNQLLKEDGVYAKLWKHQSGGFIGEK